MKEIFKYLRDNMTYCMTKLDNFFKLNPFLKEFKSNFIKIKARILNFCIKHEDMLMVIFQHSCTIILYGLMLSIAFNYLFSSKISFLSIISDGIIFFMVSEEFPEIVSKCRGVIHG